MHILFRWKSQMKLSHYATDFGLYTVSQKTSKIIFVITTSNFHQIWHFWHKDGKQSKIIRGAPIFHLNEFMSMHNHVKCKCSKLLHNAVDLIISIRLLTFAPPIRQKAPHYLIILWFKCYSTLKRVQQLIYFPLHFRHNGFFKGG